MKISLGPVLYYWQREPLLEFYEQMIRLPVEVIYLGETVCSKRRALRVADWIGLARHLAVGGRQIVLSTLTLIEAESEISTLTRLCNNGELLVEANDMAAVQLLAEKHLPFVAGPALNIYNAHALRYLHERGMTRWVAPLELSGEILGNILRQAAEIGFADKLEVEIFSFGRMPLAHSARCFTARAHNLPKDDCGFVCGNYPDGLPMHTQEGRHFLTLNGIQTQSGDVLNLLAVWRDMRELGVKIMRISPQSHHMREIVQSLHAALRGETLPDLEPFLDGAACNGYWYGEAGMVQVPATYPGIKSFSSSGPPQ